MGCLRTIKDNTCGEANGNVEKSRNHVGALNSKLRKFVLGSHAVKKASQALGVMVCPAVETSHGMKAGGTLHILSTTSGRGRSWCHANFLHSVVPPEWVMWTATTTVPLFTAKL